MQKSYFDVTIIIGILFTIILYPLLPTLAHGQQQQLFPFSYPTTMTTANQSQNESTTSYSFSAHYKKADNNNANFNDNENGDIVNVNDNDNADIKKPSDDGSNNTPKAVILNFYDNDIGQFTNAKPILDKYGFKVTFFIVCKWASSDNNPDRMNWKDITQLYREGHDIESHSTTHKVLNRLSADDLDYEVGQSKQCIYDHIGVKPTVISPPHNQGGKNATVIDTIAKYYDLAIGGFVTGPMFLHCDGWKQRQQQSSSQTDCRTYSDDGTLNYANRYGIKEVSHNGLDNRYSHDDTQTFEKFVQLVNSEVNYNKDGAINAIPIIGYHNIEDDTATTSTHVDLFYKEMKYLHDNGFKVITMSDLGYEENSKYLYVKNSE
jgi:peptidoglycan/xylan/chitin deacetylase (PgdA/CDA1 family)